MISTPSQAYYYGWGSASLSYYGNKYNNVFRNRTVHLINARYGGYGLGFWGLGYGGTLYPYSIYPAPTYATWRANHTWSHLLAEELFNREVLKLKTENILERKKLDIQKDEDTYQRFEKHNAPIIRKQFQEKEEIEKKPSSVLNKEAESVTVTYY